MDNTNDTEAARAARWDAAVAGFEDACRKQDALREQHARHTATTADTVREYTGHAQRAATRDVVEAYPDARVVFVSLELRAGARPAVVLRWRVEYPEGVTVIVRLEDAVWVVTDDDGTRTGPVLAELVAVLA